MGKITRLRVALGEACEDSGDLRVALGGHDGATAAEGIGIEAVPIGPAHGEVMHHHGVGEFLCHVAARVFEKRDEIVGARPGHGILKVDDADSQNAHFGSTPDQVLGMVVAVNEDGHGAAGPAVVEA